MMHKSTNLMIALVFLLGTAVPALATPPLDIGVEGLFTNLAIPQAQISASTFSSFPWSNWGIGGQGYISGAFNEDFSFKVALISDPIMRNYISTMVMYQTGFASIGIGPIIGLLNSAETPVKSGLSTNVRMEWPGVLFVSVKADSSIGAALSAKGDYLQETGEIAAGFYVPNAICSLAISTRKFYSQINATDMTMDSLARYTFSVDIFKKRSPYNVITSLGYQSLSKKLADGTTEELGSLILGAHVNARISLSVKLIAAFESSVYAFGLQNLAGRGPDPTSLMFSARLGVVISLPGSNDQPSLKASAFVEDAPVTAPAETESPAPTEENTTNP